MAKKRLSNLAYRSVERDGAGVSSAWERIAENRIAEALEQGEFENLPGKGRPLDLTAYFGTPADDRIAFSVLKNAGVMPNEVELMNQVEELERRLQTCNNQAEARHLKQQVQAQRVKLTLAMERRKLRKKPD